jgi:hypothetical protein
MDQTKGGTDYLKPVVAGNETDTENMNKSFGLRQPKSSAAGTYESRNSIRQSIS